MKKQENMTYILAKKQIIGTSRNCDQRKDLTGMIAN